MHMEELLSRIIQISRQAFGNTLIGVYLHGSLALGCFNPAKSDIDFIEVVRRPPSLTQKEYFLKELLELEPFCPPKGLETSVVLEANCRNFVYPTPYQFHYSAAHRACSLSDPTAFCRRMQGCDRDLAAHFTIIRQKGRVLWGRPISQVFGPVPAADYLDSIREDIIDAETSILQDPIYMILNLCRVLAFAEEGLILSKAAGGQWAAVHLESYMSLIGQALECYGSERELSCDASILSLFARDMLHRIDTAIQRMPFPDVQPHIFQTIQPDPQTRKADNSHIKR